MPYFLTRGKMADDYAQQAYSDKYFSDINTRIRDLEEKQRLIKDRMLLISESFVKEREKNFQEIQEMKKTVEKLKEDNRRIKEILFKFGEKLDSTARKEEVKILQRQFNIFRGDK